jgi:hypothetical protein
MYELKTYPLKNSTIQRIYFEKDEIYTDPEYQRSGEIWTLEKRQLLIDSILNDYDIPKLYFHDLNTPMKLKNGQKVLYTIIDGKQRLETIWKFKEDKFSLAEDFRYYKEDKVKAGGLKYSELSKKYQKLKVIFDSFILPIICVSTNDMDLIEDMFSRLNEAVPLNAAEKRNAFGGPMAKTIRNVSNHHFFKEKVRISNKRYQHREISARLLFLDYCIGDIKKIYDTKKAYLDWFVKLFKKKSELHAPKYGNQVQFILNEMLEVFHKKDVLLRAQSSIPIYYLLFMLAKDQGRLDNISRKKLIDFNNKILQNRKNAEQDIAKADYELLEYHRMSIQGTNDASSIRERVRIIANNFNIDGILTKK